MQSDGKKVSQKSAAISFKEDKVRELLHEFIPAEITLETISFFSPSTRKLKYQHKEKTFITKLEDGSVVETKITIAPSTLYGLPIGVDFDLYRAFQKILFEYIEEGGDIDEPIKVPTKKLLTYAGIVRSKRSRQEVQTFLSRLASTTINGELYDHRSKRWIKFNRSPFAEVIQYGQELPGGDVAETNYVWLAPFYKQNLSEGRLRNIDFEFHRKLKNPLSKCLYPLLQTGWYASGNIKYTKRYSDLCAELLLKEHSYLASVTRQFESALTELKRFGFLKSYKVLKTNDGKDFKFEFLPGKYYLSVQRQLNERREIAQRIAAATSKKLLSSEQEYLLERILNVCGDLHSERYYRMLIAEENTNILEMALSETKDLKLRGEIKKSAGAFFVSAVKDIKEKRQKRPN